MNSVFVIEAYRHAGTWAFTDKAKDLIDEPFVCGIPQIIDGVIGGPRCDRAYILFSATPFPGYDVALRADCAEHGGFWYTAIAGPKLVFNLRGWLCPATLKYFDGFPDAIYCCVTAL